MKPKFPYTGKGCTAATLYLKEIGKWDEFLNNRVSLDGWTLIQHANIYYKRNKEQQT